MQILIKELGNQQSRYWAGNLGGEFLTHVPDLTVTSKVEAGDPVPNPLLKLTSTIISSVLSGRKDLIVQEFPHETDPAIIIGALERTPELHEQLMGPLQALIGASCVSAVLFERSVNRY